MSDEVHEDDVNTLDDSTPLIPPTDLQEERIWNYHEFCKNVSSLSHMKVRRPMGYYHHFIVTNIYPTYHGTSMVTVVHYTSSSEIVFGSTNGVGKCVRETFELGVNVPNSLFDYSRGLYYVEPEAGYLSTREEAEAVFKRIEERLGETVYHINWNNCEHLVNYILTGKNASEQFRESRRLTDCCNLMISNIKQVGLTTALLVSALGAISGSLVQRAYVRLIMVSIVSFDAHVGVPIETKCPNLLGHNIIDEARIRINDAIDLPAVSNIPNATAIVVAIANKLNNSNVCSAAEYLAIEAVWKVCAASLVTSFAIETVIMICFLYFNVIPMRKSFLKNKAFCRILFLRIFGGYLSTVIGVGFGALGQSFMDRPAVAFFCITLATGIFFKYLLTIIAGCFFDSCSVCFCWNCCPVCNGGWKCPSIGCLATSIIIIFAVLVVALWFLLYQ